MINFLLLVSRQGKVRLSKWYNNVSAKDKTRAVRELTTLVLGRPPKMCNFIEWRDKKVSRCLEIAALIWNRIV
jgi:AP-1 complex subunit sigma 1/2